MTNELFVVLSFGKNFCKYKNKSIVIYGKGPKTKLILDVYPDYHIVGIMDGTLKEGSIYGRPILNVDNLSMLKVDIIIVVAQMETTKLIFNRMNEYCYYNHIELYSIAGKDLFEYFGLGKVAGALPHVLCQMEEAEIEKAVHNHDYIAVDIMDVLLMRKTIFAEDRFLIIEERAKREGIDLKDYLPFRLELEKWDLHLQLNDIYMKIQESLKLADGIRDRLLQIELELEQSWIIPRRKVVDLVRTGVEAGKRLYLLNNTRLPMEFLERILSQSGIFWYESIVTESDIGDELKKKEPKSLKRGIYMGTAASDWIGDIEVVPIISALEQFRQSSYAYLERYLINVNDRSLMSLCIERVFNNPFVLQADGRPHLTEATDIGCAFLGAILSNFIIWLMEKSKGRYYDGILFAARDGFLLQKMYRYLAKRYEMETSGDIYFYASRRLCAAAAMETKEDISWLAGISYQYDPEQMLQDKFGLRKADIVPYEAEKFGNSITYSLMHCERIYQRSKEIRENYLTYMGNHGIKKNGRYLFVDFLSVGTCQYFLERIVPFQMDSAYLCRHHNENNRVSIVLSDSLLENQAPYAAESYFYEHIFFPETVLTSPEASVASLDEAGNPIWAKEERSKLQLEYVELMQNALLNFFEDYITNFYIMGQPLDPTVSDRIYNLMAEGYTELDCDILKEICLVDGLGLTKVLPKY